MAAVGQVQQEVDGGLRFAGARGALDLRAGMGERLDEGAALFGVGAQEVRGVGETLGCGWLVGPGRIAEDVGQRRAVEHLVRRLGDLQELPSQGLAVLQPHPDGQHRRVGHADRPRQRRLRQGRRVERPPRPFLQIGAGDGEVRRAVGLVKEREDTLVFLLGDVVLQPLLVDLRRLVVRLDGPAAVRFPRLHGDGEEGYRERLPRAFALDDLARIAT